MFFYFLSCLTTSITVPSLHSTTPMMRSVVATGSVGPDIFRARAESSSMDITGSPLTSETASKRSLRRGLIVIPYSVTIASTTSPGVVTL